MRKQITSLLVSALLCCCGVAKAANFDDLIPRPAQMEQAEGQLTLTSGFAVSTAGLPQEMTDEVAKFVKAINATTALNATTSQGDALVKVSIDSSLPAEGYSLAITANGVDIKAANATGLFYAFQTIKKLLPVNVNAGKPGAAGAVYALPLGTIADQPRFEYRGFMLDVSRHFFDVAQVKKMLDLMAVYKLNRFHWHLTDDQGWRLPVAKYPKLTVEGATNKDILRSDFDAQTQWREGANVAYGPYAYTADEIKEIVAYAKERHIEVIPEIDMPGHMVAAIHAYPEFSTDPESKKLSLHQDFSHEIWNKGGVSRDVLDVSNPKVIQFVKDVVDELAVLFPYQYIHIGGDECPTLAWENSDACKAKMQELGLSNARALQSWFTKQIADYAREQHGRKVMGWNELITEGNVDMNMIKEIDPTIFCWIGGESKAEANGLKHVYTPFNGGYYINRSYSGFDKIGAVGDGALSTTINVNPPANSNCIGVQGTFWTEQVDRNKDLEYLALPRLIGIAEQGWSPIVNKDYEEFIDRVIRDTEYLDAAGYDYGAHQLVKPEYNKPEAQTWYRIQTKSSDERANKVWEVLHEGSPLISAQSGKGAKAGRLWANTIDENSDYQLFRFIENPDNAGHYAIVCKGFPEGSLNSNPTGTALTDRWDYKAEGLDYGFVLDKANYGDEDNGDFYYAITTDNISGLYMNFSKNGQGLAINVYNAPKDGNGGLMRFVAVSEEEEPGGNEEPVVSTEFNPGVYYRLLTRFNGDSSQPRYGSCIELLTSDAGKGNNAQANRLWSNLPVAKDADNYDYQWFAFEADPAGSGYYALVCKAKPQGSVNSVPSVANNSNTARWDYDDAEKHYGFYLVDNVNGKQTQGVDEKGFYSAFTSKDAAEGWYVNTSANGQGYSVHLYSDPTDQNAGIYTFEPDPATVSIADIKAETPAAEGIFDLLGRRLTDTKAPGLYIINGTKVLVK